MNLETMFQQAEELYICGEYNKALTLFEKINAVRADNDSRNYIGCCHIELGEFQRAREVFAQLILDAPDWERPCFNMGRTYLREGG